MEGGAKGLTLQTCRGRVWLKPRWPADADAVDQTACLDEGVSLGEEIWCAACGRAD